MGNEITIPLLPCASIDDMLAFYRALGFEVKYQQSRPNNYAVVVRGGIELHFFSMRDYEPANSYSSCYIRVSDVDGLYQAFNAGLRIRYGRVPSAGIPRVIPLKNKSGRREFIVIDPGGNWIRIGQPLDGLSADNRRQSQTERSTPLARALHGATLLAESKGDDAEAAKMLDDALALEDAGSAPQRVQALVYRAGLAITIGDLNLARTVLEQVRQIPLDAAERKALTADLTRAIELEQMLVHLGINKALVV